MRALLRGNGVRKPKVAEKKTGVKPEDKTGKGMRKKEDGKDWECPCRFYDVIHQLAFALSSDGNLFSRFSIQLISSYPDAVNERRIS